MNERLNVDTVLATIGPNGAFASSLKGFEPRVQQTKMMQNVLEAYLNKHISLIEAGTGTGKSFAYLIPAVLWAAQTKERTLISTNTIPLQQQLLSKDLPVVCKALNVNVKAVIVKGMHNYLCLRKLEETFQELLLLEPKEIEEIQKIDAWQRSSNDGSRSTLNFTTTPGVWDKVAAENDTCNRNACPYYQECHFFKARKQALDAQILISNHHLLFADVTCRMENDNFKETAILPPYDRLIVDEAHNIEDVATEYFASKASYLDIVRLSGRLSGEKKGKAYGKLSFIKDKLSNHYKHEITPEIKSLIQRLTIDLPGLRRDSLQQAHDTFTLFQNFSSSFKKKTSEQNDEPSQGDGKLRLLGLHHTHPDWQKNILPSTKLLNESIERYTSALSALTKDLKFLNNPQIEEQIKAASFEINSLALRLIEVSDIVKRFVASYIPETKVRWIELQQLKTILNTVLVDANLDISSLLAENIFKKISTVILCSATLTTNKQFSFIKDRLGLNKELLNDRVVRENIYDSPFDFKKQTLLAIPTDFPAPNAPNFTTAATEMIWKTLLSSQGNAFVLFTSYSMLSECYSKLQKKMQEHLMHPLKQGDEDRQILLDKFKNVDRSVLFGTDSFWEGVDVVGEALRCVIIVKLPFKVPSEPLVQARSEVILAKGGDPFMDYSLPQAIVKFKQGFGRLIRNKFDRGCVLCLDNRILVKRYGNQILNSLPDCQRAFTTSDVLQDQIKEFYRRTYFMTQNRF